MTFNKISTESGCVCIDDCCTQDPNHVFIRKISKGSLRDSDFRTHWERKKRPESQSSCQEECKRKGLSFYLSPEGDSIIDQWGPPKTIVQNERKNTRAG